MDWNPKLVDVYNDPDRLAQYLIGDPHLCNQVEDLSVKQRERLAQVRANDHLSSLGKQAEIDRLTAEYRASVEEALSRTEARITAAEEQLQEAAKPPAYMGSNREQAELARARVLQEANLLAGGPWEAVLAAFERDLEASGPKSPEVDAWLRYLEVLAEKSGLKGGQLVVLRQRVRDLREQQLSDRNQKALTLLQAVAKARVGVVQARNVYMSRQYFLR